MSDNNPTPSAAGSDALYGHSAEGIKAAQEDVVIPGTPDDDQSGEDDPEVKHEDGLA